jgi:hypothetical protein
MPLLHSGSPLCGRRPIPSVVHNFPGSKFSWRRFLSTMPLCMTGHLPAGGSQLPLGSTISLGEFLWLFASPCS